MPHTAQGVGHRNIDTSQAAAEQIEGKAPFWRVMVLQELSLNGPGTADEIAHRLRAPVLTIRPRLSELRGAGKIHDTGLRRANTSGKTAAVWEITKKEDANV